MLFRKRLLPISEARLRTQAQGRVPPAPLGSIERTCRPPRGKRRRPMPTPPRGGGDGIGTDDDGSGSNSNGEAGGGGSSTNSSEEDVVTGLRGIMRDSEHHPPPARRSPSPTMAAAQAAAAAAAQAAEPAAAAAAAAPAPAVAAAPCDATVARLKSLADSERRREARERQAREGAAEEEGAPAPRQPPPPPPQQKQQQKQQQQQQQQQPGARRARSTMLGGYAPRAAAAAAAPSAAAPPAAAAAAATAATTPPAAPATTAGGGGGSSNSGGDFSDANFPRDGDGRTLHLGTRRGEVAPRILSVGSMDRALALAALLAPPRPGGALFQHLSPRGFLTVTGRYAGRPVSVVTTLMGMPNMDFVARECRAVVDGSRQVAIVRLGTCGGLRPPVRLGDFCVASGGARCLRRNPDAFFAAAAAGGEGDGLEEEEEEEEEGPPAPYHLSRLVPADPELSALLAHACKERTNGGVGAGLMAQALNGNGNGNGHSARPSHRHPNHSRSHGHHSNHHQHQRASSSSSSSSTTTTGDALSASVLAAGEDGACFAPAAVHTGRNVTADGFYSSQGRQGDGTFDDRNAGLVEEVLARDPLALSMEMETFHLLDLARCSRPMEAGEGAASDGGGGGGGAAPPPLQRRALRAAAVAITAAERYSNAFIGKRLLRRRELEGGLAALDALVRCELLGDDGDDDAGGDRAGAAGASCVWSIAP
jgi:uridine phosphorylase